MSSTPLPAARPVAQWGWLAGAILFQGLAGFDRPVALAAWIAPILLLRFVRLQPAGRGLLAAWAATAGVDAVVLNGVVPMPAGAYAVFVAGFALAAILPLAVDRVSVRRLPDWAGTLVFPCALVSVQGLFSFGPFASWGSLGYSQTGNLALMQTAAVAGLWGTAFLIGWTAAAINLALERGLARAGRVLAAVGAVGLAVLLAGEIRLATPPGATVRVAGLTPRFQAVLLDKAVAGQMSPDEDRAFHAAYAAARDDLLARTAREAQAGAKIVFWSEAALHVLKPDEAGLIAAGRALAAKHGIYLGLSTATWTPKAAKPLETKLTMITPQGGIGWVYLKSHPVPGTEAAQSVPAAGVLPHLDTPYGRISAVICFDADSPGLVAQAGRLGADILLVPGNDWPAITPLHTAMASVRAIEQGVNLVRQTKGYAAAFDAFGRPLAGAPVDPAAPTLVVQVPVKGVRTPYAAAGDWLIWLSLAGLLGLIGAAVRPRRPD